MSGGNRRRTSNRSSQGPPPQFEQFQNCEDGIPSVPPLPKHINFPDVPHNEFFNELFIFAFTIVSVLTQFMHLYRTVWWLPDSYTHQTIVRFCGCFSCVLLIIFSSCNRTFTWLIRTWPSSFWRCLDGDSFTRWVVSWLNWFVLRRLLLMLVTLTSTFSLIQLFWFLVTAPLTCSTSTATCTYSSCLIRELL